MNISNPNRMASPPCIMKGRELLRKGTDVVGGGGASFRRSGWTASRAAMVWVLLWASKFGRLARKRFNDLARSHVMGRGRRASLRRSGSITSQAATVWVLL